MNECQEDIGKEVLGNKPEVDVTNNAEVKVSKINEKVKNATNNITNKIFASIGAKIALIILVILLLKGGHLYIKSKFNWNFSLFNSELIIDKTANVVDQIKKISEFTTINYYDESVLKKERFVSSNNSIMNFFNVQTDSIHEEIVIIAKGVVRAGFNLSRIKEEDIIAWCKYNDLTFINCACHFTEKASINESSSKRNEMKNLVKKMRKNNPNVDYNIYKALDNVNLNCVIGTKKNGEYESFLKNY